MREHPSTRDQYLLLYKREDKGQRHETRQELKEEEKEN
jgi:hypothetical protein